MGILFETTGFQLERDEKAGCFWENYRDFEELGSTNLVREDKNEAIGAMISPLKKKVNMD